MPLDASPRYRRFSKRQASLFRVAQLWAAHDHLMLVTSVYAFESYQRFYFHDIEALVIRPTNARRNTLIVCVCLLALFGGLAAYLIMQKVRAGLGVAGDSALVFGIICGSVATVLLMIVLAQLILGPTCQVYLQMRTGLEKLGMYYRLRPALKARGLLLQALAEQAALNAAPPP